MLFMYIIGLISQRGGKPWILAAVCAGLTFGFSMMFGAELGCAAVDAIAYFALGLAWFLVLAKLSETIVLWFLVFLPGPFLMSLAILALNVAMYPDAYKVQA